MLNGSLVIRRKQLQSKGNDEVGVVFTVLLELFSVIVVGLSPVQSQNSAAIPSLQFRGTCLEGLWVARDF